MKPLKQLKQTNSINKSFRVSERHAQIMADWDSAYRAGEVELSVAQLVRHTIKQLDNILKEAERKRLQEELERRTIEEALENTTPIAPETRGRKVKTLNELIFTPRNKQ